MKNTIQSSNISSFSIFIWCIVCLLMTRKTRNKNTAFVRKMNCGIKKCAMWIFFAWAFISVCVSQIKMNDSYENRNWQAKNVVLCRRHIILNDLMPSFGCISCTTLEAWIRCVCVCVIGDCFRFVFYPTESLSRVILSQFKNIFLPKRMHSVMRKDTDEIYEEYKEKIKTKQNQ